MLCCKSKENAQQDNQSENVLVKIFSTRFNGIGIKWEGINLLFWLLMPKVFMLGIPASFFFFFLTLRKLRSAA